MNSLSAKWNHFWFKPDGPETLGFIRLLIMLGGFLYYRTLNLESWGYTQQSMFQPISFFKALHLHPYSPHVMAALGFIWKASLILGAIGLFSRASCAIAFILGLYLVGLPDNLGKIDHNDGIMLWSFLVLAIGRSGDAWSLDRLIRTARGKGSPLSLKDPKEAHAEYRWPVRMMQFMMAMIFCLCGIAKLRFSGLAWAFSDNLKNLFILQHYVSKPPTDWSLTLAAYPKLCEFLALMTLIVETSMPLALFNKWARWFLLVSLFMMQLGNEVLLGINFRQFMLCYAWWIPWSDVGRFLRTALGGNNPPALTVLFDGSCGLCQRTVNIIRRIDLRHRVEIIDALNDWETVAKRYPTLTQDQCMLTMHAVDDKGAVTTGFFAYRRLCALIPMWWPMFPFLFIPPVPAVGQAVYQKVADRRFRNGCGINDRPELTKASV
jgi:predicted DCC family thiol-disulfide oxidoreductase YuxK